MRNAVNGDGRPREHRASGNLVRGLASANSQPSRQLPAFRLFDGVRPATEQRRQRTAAPPHPPARTRPARPETRTNPLAPATKRQQPQPAATRSPPHFHDATTSPGHQRLFDAYDPRSSNERRLRTECPICPVRFAGYGVAPPRLTHDHGPSGGRLPPRHHAAARVAEICPTRVRHTSAKRYASAQGSATGRR